MPISSVITNNVNISANTIRYSLSVVKRNNKYMGTLELKRCSSLNDEWIDDPSEDSRKIISIPTSLSLTLDALFNMINSVFNSTYDNVNIRTILKNKELIVSLFIRGRESQTVSIENLSEYLSNNQDKYVEIMTCWASLNLAIEALNNDKGYI